MKTTFTYDHYYLYEELTSNIDYFIKKFPNLLSKESILKTEDNMNIWALTLSNNSVNPSLKPALYIDANTHAGEVTGSMAAMHFLDYILTNHNDDSNISKLLNDYTIYIIPRITVSGSEIYLTSAYSMRSSNREYYKNEIGLKAYDLNEDGVITMMRIKDPLGAWKQSNKHPLIMEKRLPDEQEGEFYNIYSEGTIDIYDGLNITVAKPLWGLDFNRNYPFGWFNEHRQQGAGSYPLSNPENKAVVDFVLNHLNIGIAASHHTSGGVMLYPPGTKPSKDAEKLDMKFYQEIGKIAKTEMGYPSINIFDHFMEDQVNYHSGAFDDWCYQTLGILAYTTELWDVLTKANNPISWENKQSETSFDTKLEQLNSVINWATTNTPNVIRNWTTYNHETLGEVELGGFDFKFLQQNPPVNYLLSEIENCTKFTLRYLNTLPKLNIKDISTTKLGNNIYKLEATIYNTGYLPTYISQEAKNIKVNKDINIILNGDYKLLSIDSDIKELGGFGTINTYVDFYGGIKTGNSLPQAKKVSYIIETNSNELELVITSEKAGQIINKIKI